MYSIDIFLLIGANYAIFIFACLKKSLIYELNFHYKKQAILSGAAYLREIRG
jgi:hypothetical protein